MPVQQHVNTWEIARDVEKEIERFYISDSKAIKTSRSKGSVQKAIVRLGLENELRWTSKEGTNYIFKLSSLHAS